MARNDRNDAKQRIHATVEDYGLISAGTQPHWRQAIIDELKSVDGLNVSADALNIFNRLLSACVAQAGGGDPGTPYMKMAQSVAERVQSFGTKQTAPVETHT